MHIFKKKFKKQSKLPQPDHSLGISTIVPSGSRVELNHQDGNPKPAQIVSRNDNIHDPGPPTKETSIPNTSANHEAESRNEQPEEYIGYVKQGETEPVVVSTVSERGQPSSALAAPIDLTKDAEDGFGSLRAALETICAGSAENKETTIIRKEIENLLPRVVTLGERFQTLPHDIQDQRRRQALIDKAKDIEGRLLSLHESQGLQHHTGRSKDDEITLKILEDLQDSISDYQVAHQMTIQEEECQRMGSDEATVLNNFRCVQEAEYRHGNRKGCLWGTRSGILGEIERWSSDFDGPSVYWLNGLAGTGKTTIAQTTAERLFADGWLGASFFCSRDFDDRSNLQFIFPTLAVQLAHRYPEFRSILVPLVRSDSTIAHESLYNQMNKLIVRPLTKSAVSTVIVIDALDECKDEEPASAILSVLGQFVSQIPNVKFFLTGRPEPRIREGFRLPLLEPSTEVFVLHSVESGQVNSDIQLFFRRRFSELATRRHGLDSWPSERQLGLLCERTAGLFVYAVASVKFIQRKNSNPRKQLDRLLQAPGNSSFEGKTRFNADKTIDSLYMSILWEAFGDGDLEDDPKIRSILGAVILATNPLSPSSIAVLLGLDAEDVFPPLSSAHSLLILHEDVDQPVRPFHKSFPDFMVDPARCAEQRFRVCPADHHTELVVGCLKLLDQKLERNMCKLPDWVTNSEVDDLKERTGQCISQALEYACRSWHKHLVETTPASKPDITPVLHRFLERKFLFWLEVLSVLGTAREAVDALEAAGKWLDESLTLDLVNDCSRFVITFFELINTSAPHIYHSAIFLSPRTSIVRRLYEQYACPLARVVHGFPVSWEPTVATMYTPQHVSACAWSPCGRFIAVGCDGSYVVEILDAMTLGKIKTFTASSSDDTTRLSFSPNGHLLTRFGKKLGLTSWDVQTGGPVCAIPSVPHTEPTWYESSTYSTDGEMVAVLCRCYPTVVTDPAYSSFDGIRTYNLVSGRHIYSYRIPEGRIIPSLWTHDERLRFATAKPGCITIWEAEFTSIHTLTEVETLPLPDEFDDMRDFLFLPTLYRLVLWFKEVVVWDARDSRSLLKLEGAPLNMDFSPDGLFFACGPVKKNFRVWRESPAGYVPHQELSVGWAPGLRFSPNGESIIMTHPRALRLWHTKTPTSVPSGVPEQFASQEDFIPGFSTGGTLAAVTRVRGNIITILDLESGELRFTIDAGMDILGLRVTEGAIVVVGKGKVVTWSLPARDYDLDTEMNTSDSVRSVTFNSPDDYHYALTSPAAASVSPDLNYIAIMAIGHRPSDVTSPGSRYESDICVLLYSLATGERLAAVELGKLKGRMLTPWFSPDTYEVWCGFGSHTWGYAIVDSGEPDLVKLNQIGPDVSPSGGFPWESSRGYEVTHGGWVLSPLGKRLLWLPHSWRSDYRVRTWQGRVLGLFHDSLPEAVILEFHE